MKIKKGDKVVVRAGKDRGKTGTVIRAFPREGKVIVEGLNMAKRHQRASRENSKGQIVEREMPLQVSNVMIADPKTGKPTRVRIDRSNGKYTRIAQKSGTKL